MRARGRHSRSRLRRRCVAAPCRRRAALAARCGRPGTGRSGADAVRRHVPLARVERQHAAGRRGVGAPGVVGEQPADAPPVARERLPGPGHAGVGAGDGAERAEQRGRARGVDDQRRVPQRGGVRRLEGAAAVGAAPGPAVVGQHHARVSGDRAPRSEPGPSLVGGSVRRRRCSSQSPRSPRTSSEPGSSGLASTERAALFERLVTMPDQVAPPSFERSSRAGSRTALRATRSDGPPTRLGTSTGWPWARPSVQVSPSSSLRHRSQTPRARSRGPSGTGTGAPERPDRPPARR